MLTTANQSRNSRLVAKGTIVQIGFQDMEDILPLVFFGKPGALVADSVVGSFGEDINDGELRQNTEDLAP